MPWRDEMGRREKVDLRCVKRILLCIGRNDNENLEAAESLDRLGDAEIRITGDMACLDGHVSLPYIVLDDFLDDDKRNNGTRFYGLDSIQRFVRELTADVIEE